MAFIEEPDNYDDLIDPSDFNEDRHLFKGAYVECKNCDEWEHYTDNLWHTRHLAGIHEVDPESDLSVKVLISNSKLKMVLDERPEDIKVNSAGNYFIFKDQKNDEVIYKFEGNKEDSPSELLGILINEIGLEHELL